jgi:hypothetical protein
MSQKMNGGFRFTARVAFRFAARRPRIRRHPPRAFSRID